MSISYDDNHYTTGTSFSSIDTTAAWKKLRFILSVRSDLHMIDSLISLLQIFHQIKLKEKFKQIKISIFIRKCFVRCKKTKINIRGCPRGVMVKAMDCGIVVCEFVLQSRYYVHFRANTLGKGMNPLILPAMG